MTSTTSLNSLKGIVKWFNLQKGFGFIQPQNGGKDVFVHISTLTKSGIPTLTPGQGVSYELSNNKGKVAAVKLKLEN